MNLNVNHILKIFNTEIKLRLFTCTKDINPHDNCQQKVMTPISSLVLSKIQAFGISQDHGCDILCKESFTFYF